MIKPILARLAPSASLLLGVITIPRLHIHGVLVVGDAPEGGQEEHQFGGGWSDRLRKGWSR